MSAVEGFPDKIQDYSVLESLGQGVFGMVLHAFNVKTSEVVALKVLKNNEESDLKSEVEMLYKVREHDPDKYNIVKFIDFFTWHGFNCMAFEKLDRSLFDYMQQRGVSFSLSETRVITYQLLVAFDYLKQQKIVHTDLKLDNVMLVNQKEKPFKVKLIDFGLAMHKSELMLGMPLQPSLLRAPEVTLGLPLTEAIDMWALGCLLLDMHLGSGLFSGSSPYNNQRTIIQMLGYPPDNLLNQGIYSRLYYHQQNGQWRLKTPGEYQLTTGMDPKVKKNRFECFEDLMDLITSKDPNTYQESIDKIGFHDMVKDLLNLDYENRITPKEGLNHPFLTMKYFVNHENNEYVQLAQSLNALVFRKNILINSTGCGPAVTTRQSWISQQDFTDDIYPRNPNYTVPEMGDDHHNIDNFGEYASQNSKISSGPGSSFQEDLAGDHNRVDPGYVGDDEDNNDSFGEYASQNSKISSPPGSN